MTDQRQCGEYSHSRSSGRRWIIADEPIRQRSIDKFTFGPEALGAAARLLGGTLRVAEFRLPDAVVWQIDVPGRSGEPVITLTCWPSIQRVDASSPHLTVVMTEILGVELVEGVEVVFRRRDSSYLIVPIGGKVIVRS